MSMMLVMPTQAQDAQTDLIGRINALRASLGLSPYSLNGALNAAAANQASWMATTKEVSHVQTNGSRPRDRAQAAGYGSDWVSENIYMGTDTSANTAWTFWLNSPVHYAGLTNTNYQHVGIASATVDGWTAFVLVFGNPGGAAAPRVNVAGGGGEQSAAGPPPWVVGVDPNGNIMHEVRDADTWGDILLEYGYTWDDLERVLALNGKLPIPEDIRSIKPGDVVLVPPYEGTYTPTPEAPAENTNATPPAQEDLSAQDTGQETADETINTVTAAPTGEAAPDDELGIIETQPSGEETAEAQNDASEATMTPQTAFTATLQPTVIIDLAASITPSPTVSPTGIQVVSASTQPALMIRTLPARTLESSQPTAESITEVASVPQQADDDAPPPWLILVLGLQVCILGVAGFQLMKQRKD